MIVISGPSGVGKDTVLRRLFELDPKLKYSVSYTTRPPRPGEIDGQSYTFVSEAEFLDLIEQKEFLEWAKVYDHYYGTSRRRVEDALTRGEDIILNIDVQHHRHSLRKSNRAQKVDEACLNIRFHVKCLPMTAAIAHQRLRTKPRITFPLSRK